MFSAIYDTIRAYIIRKLAEIVAQDIINSGLTDEDRTTIDAAITADADIGGTARS